MDSKASWDLSTPGWSGAELAAGLLNLCLHGEERGREGERAGWKEGLPGFVCLRAAPSQACVLHELAASVLACTGGTVTILDPVAFYQDPSLLP